MRATLDFLMRTVVVFRHICATYNHAYNIEHRTGNTGIIVHPTCRGVSEPECTGSLFRGCQFRAPTVAANSVAADSQSLPYPSRKPPTRGRQYICTSSP